MRLLHEWLSAIDMIFVAVFARYRRRPNYSLEQAWRAAEYQVGTFLTLPLVVLVLLLFFVLWPTHRPETLLQRRLALAVTVGAGLFAHFLLSRRFKGFLLDPPELLLAESPEQSHLIVVFRLICVATLLVGLTVFGLRGIYGN